MKNTNYITTILNKSILILFVFVSALIIASPVLASPQSDYDKYKVELERLQENAKKSKYRHYWLDLAEEFYDLYKNNPRWANRTAALYRAAVAYDELSRRSYSSKDRKEAVRLYDKVIKEFPTSVLADDALYQSAVFHHEELKNSNEAISRLEKITKKYKDADHYDDAKKYIAQLDGTLTASLGLDLDTLSPALNDASNAVIYKGLKAHAKKDIIQIKVEVDASKRKNNIVTWSVDYLPPQEKTHSPARLILTLNHTRTEADVKPGYKFKSMGILSRFVIDYSKRNATVIMLDFKDLSAYYAYYDKASSTIVIETTNKKNALAKGITTKEAVVATKIPSDLLPRDFAVKLGLKVKTIIIDPGHGGKDPGTSHNGIIEKDLVLDLSKKLGNELEKLGYNVEYTRTKDVFITLDRRVKIAAEKKGDLFISVHANAADNSRLAGLETYYLDYSRSPETQHIADRENGGSEHRMGSMENIVDDLVHSALMFESQRLAAIVHTQMYGLVSKKGYNSQNGGTKGSLFKVLEESKMPGIMLEVGYVSNGLDAKNLKNKNFVQTLAEGVADGIHYYAKDLNLASK